MTCPFCRELANPRYGCVLLGEDWPFEDRILAQEAEAFAIAGYGPQVFPYALVLTNRHISCLGQSSDGERASLLGCLDSLLELSVFSSGRLSVFEHGGRGKNACSCLEHCHLHVIDGQYPAIEWLRDEEDVHRQVTLEVSAKFEAAEPYIFAGGYDGQTLDGIIAHPEDRWPQYFRHVLASRLGHRRWDWREGMNRDYMVQLVTAAKHFRETGCRGEQNVSGFGTPLASHDGSTSSDSMKE